MNFSWYMWTFGDISRFLGHGKVITSHRILWDIITYPCPRYLLQAPKLACFLPCCCCDMFNIVQYWTGITWSGEVWSLLWVQNIISVLVLQLPGCYDGGHDMGMPSTLLALCEENPPVNSGCFLWCHPKQLIWTNGWVTWDLRRHDAYVTLL